MDTAFDRLQEQLKNNPKTWLVTGAAGFIGSNLVIKLLQLNQRVIGLDNFSTGYQKNVNDISEYANSQGCGEFTFIEGDIRDLETCLQSCQGVDIVLHQAALGSVPRSIKDPINTNQSNVDGFLNILVAARDSGVKRFVYASSSSVYGDEPGLPKIENKTGNLLSPYAVSKYVNELYAAVFGRLYKIECVGLRYFNVFGPRQDPNGAYAAVIPKWFAGILSGEDVIIYGDGETSRDFCYIDNVVQANILAGSVKSSEAVGQVFNIACGEKTTLNELFQIIRKEVEKFNPEAVCQNPIYKDFREGDIMHSLANIDKAKELLGYKPIHFIGDGLVEAAKWYVENS